MASDSGASDSGASDSGADSDLIRRATFAGKHSVALGETIKSYKSIRPLVCALVEETSALAEALYSLIDAASANTESQNPALAMPLERCAWACQQFEQQIKRLSTSDARGTKSCAWGMLRYMGEDTNGFKQLLSGYRTIITFALTMATVQVSPLTVDDTKKYSILLSAAEGKLESRFARLDDMLAQNLTGLETESDLVQINKEMQSAEQCLRICAEFSEHIAEAQLTNANKSPRSNNKGNIESDSASEESTSDGLQELKERVSRMKSQLASTHDRRFSRLVQKMATINNSSATAASELAADLAMMRKESKLTREMTDELSSTLAKLEIEKASCVFENRGKGDVLQFLVSTKGETLRGKNEGVGRRVQQFVGYAADETVRQVSKDMSKNSYLSAKTSEELSESADAVMAQVVHGESAHLPGPLAIAFTGLHPATSHEPLAKVLGSRPCRLR